MGSIPLPNCLPRYVTFFFIVQDLNESAKYLNLDLSVISRWTDRWKRLFNPNPKKPAHEVIFSRKRNEETHPSVFYNNIEVSSADSQKHLGLILDNKLIFKKHFKDKLNKAYFGVGKIKRLCDILPRDSLVTINHLLGLTWITVMLFMTNQIMIRLLQDRAITI